MLNFANVNWSGILSRIYADRDRVSAEEIALGTFISDIDNRYGNRISRILKPEKAGFDEIINYFRHLLAKPEPSAAERKAVHDIARALYTLLFSGLEEVFVGKEELLIIPGGTLALLPFEALIMPDAKYMVERFQIMYAQSLTVLEILEARRYKTESKKPLLAFGGAVYEEGSYSEAIVESEKQLEAFRRNTELALSRGLGAKKMYDRLGYGTWRNLPGTLAEVKRIEAEVPGARLYTGQRVDESVVKDLSKKGELKDYRVIHFATHGLVVPEMPELSALVLSQMLNRNDTEDGYLRMGEIVKLDLEATFVNLSACETGLGKIYGGEGVVGLTQSFLVGGANGLSVSLWQVADESTMEFMVGMYRLANQEGMSYPKAITEMKRRFIRGKYPAPFYWAPFVYYGK